ncbi:MAG: tetratricopeptide repeat protein [Alphaproteobacteria bacterium]|nr:tetratricopeptide repeat protein [Alphaproteobacteria bacterium]
MRHIVRVIIAAIFAVGSIVRPALGQGFSLISDAEIEATIRAFSDPIFVAAGLSTDSVRVHIVNDRNLNAFVADGQRIFVFTGLLMQADHAGQVVGVIAHETAHIAGGHLVRMQDALRNATATSIVALILGAAAVAAGGGGGAIVAGAGAQAGQQTFLQYTRTQESVADQAAVKYLTSTGQSARGLIETLGKLSGQEALLSSSQSSYVRTHPLTRERIQLLSLEVENSPYAATPVRADFNDAFARMKAKLVGFLAPERALRDYPERDRSVAARYARAIAYHKLAQWDRSHREIDELLSVAPGDPFFQELKGQILLESGKPAEAIAYYTEATRLAPRQPLLELGLAQAQIATNDTTLNRAAIPHLEEAVRHDPDIIQAWQLLSIAYGRNQQFGLSSLASAERALRTGRMDEARGHATRAERELPVGSPGYLRAQDIVNAARPRPRQ